MNPYKSIICYLFIFNIFIIFLNGEYIKSFFNNKSPIKFTQNSLNGCEITVFLLFNFQEYIENKNNKNIIIIENKTYEPIYFNNNNNYIYRVNINLPITKQRQNYTQTITINNRETTNITLSESIECVPIDKGAIGISSIANLRYDIYSNSVLFSLFVDDKFDIVNFIINKNDSSINSKPTTTTTTTISTSSPSFSIKTPSFIKSDKSPLSQQQPISNKLLVTKIQNIDRTYEKVINKKFQNDDYSTFKSVYSQQAYYDCSIDVERSWLDITKNLTITIIDKYERYLNFNLQFPINTNSNNNNNNNNINNNNETSKSIIINNIDNIPTNILTIIDINNSIQSPIYIIDNTNNSSRNNINKKVIPLIGNIKSKLSIGLMMSNIIESTNKLLFKNNNYNYNNYLFNISINNKNSNFTIENNKIIKFNNKSTLSTFIGKIKSPSPLFMKLKINNNKNNYQTWYYSYPLGYKYGNSISNYLFKFDHLFSDQLISIIEPTFYCGGNAGNQLVVNKIQLSTPNFLIIDKIPPKILKININTTSNSESLIVTINASDDNSGVYEIEIANQLLLSYPHDLIKGNKLNGVYQGVFDFNSLLFDPYSSEMVESFIRIIDSNGNEQTFRYDDCYNEQGDIVPPIFPDIEIQTIDSFKFSPNRIDCSKSDIQVSLLITSVYIDITWIPKFSLIYPQLGIDKPIDSNHIFSGYYDGISGLFIVNFTVPMNSFSGEVDFIFQYQSWNNHFLKSKFPFPSNSNDVHRGGGSSEPLLSINENERGDYLGPLITSISTGINYFNITIIDHYNGFNKGEINITSNVDPIPYIFKINSLNSMTTTINDHYKSNNFILTLPIGDDLSNCKVSQVFEITGIELWDNSGWVTSYQKYNNNNKNKNNIPPFEDLNLILNNTISLKCNGSKKNNDIEPPLLYEFNFQPKTLGNDGKILFTFKVLDKDCGIYKRQPGSNPTIYILGENKKIPLEFQSEIVKEMNSSFIEYKVDAVIPIDYATIGLTVSIYGLIDTCFNFRGYSSSDLSNLSFPFKINLNNNDNEEDNQVENNSINEPMIFNYDEKTFTINGGDLIVHGINLQSDYVIGHFKSLDGDNKYSFDLMPTRILSNQLLFNLPPLNTEALSLIIEINDFNQFINHQLFIYPIGYKQLFKPCNLKNGLSINNNSVCSGNGVCTEGGCECFNNWYGVDCSSNKIANYKYLFNEYRPSTYQWIKSDINNNNCEGGYADISFFKVCEVGLSNEIVKEFDFSKLPWKVFKNYENSSFNQYNATSIMYSNKFPTENGYIGSEIKIIISKFPQNQSNLSTNLEFAGETISIKPNTLKFSIEILNYQFSSPLNTLQIIFNSTLKYNDDDKTTCISNSFGYRNLNETNLSWIVLRVNEISMVGEFIKKGIIDDKNILLSNSIIPNSLVKSINSQEISIQVAINIPNFKKKAIIDPNFQFLLGGNSDSDAIVCGKSSLLSSSSNSKSFNYSQSFQSNNLSKNDLIILIVCSIIGVIIIITIILILFKYKWWIKYKTNYIKDLIFK
ncbi:hypothetical protein ACTFIR_011644 [Dictyostelium discoideum]